MAVLNKEEKLDIIKRLASVFFSPKKVAAVIQTPFAEFLEELSDDSSEMYFAYYGNFYLSEAEYREKVVLQAKQGSSPAQNLTNKFIDDAKESMI